MVMDVRSTERRIDAASFGVEDLIVDDPGSVAALRSIVAPWIAAGLPVSVEVLECSPSDVVRRIAPHTGGLVELPWRDALQWVAWMASTAGPGGERRRGLSSGRSHVWWLLGELLQLSAEQFGRSIGAELSSLQWFRWATDVRRPSTGWDIGLAVWSASEGVTWVLHAVGPVDSGVPTLARPTPVA
jgi:hypothetical protein